jgi:hypothetical protein
VRRVAKIFSLAGEIDVSGAEPRFLKLPRNLCAVPLVAREVLLFEE